MLSMASITAAYVVKNVTGRQVRWLHADRPLLAKQSENVTDLYLPLDVISEKLVSETSTIIQTATVPATFGSTNIYRPVVLGITQPTAHHAEVFCRLDGALAREVGTLPGAHTWFYGKTQFCVCSLDVVSEEHHVKSFRLKVQQWRINNSTPAGITLDGTTIADLDSESHRADQSAIPDIWTPAFTACLDQLMCTVPDCQQIHIAQP